MAPRMPTTTAAKIASASVAVSAAAAPAFNVVKKKMVARIRALKNAAFQFQPSTSVCTGDFAISISTEVMEGGVSVDGKGAGSCKFFVRTGSKCLYLQPSYGEAARFSCIFREFLGTLEGNLNWFLRVMLNVHFLSLNDLFIVTA
jgi:hypothetical protein